MLFLTLPAKNLAFLKEKIKKYERDVDGFEIRWDFSKELYPDAVRSLTTLPLIYTLRTQDQGGQATEVHFEEMLALARAKPDYLDLQYDFPLAWFENIRSKFPVIKIIGSYHLMDDVPQSIPEIKGADIIKIAGFCKNATDALALLLMRQNIHQPFILIGMGPLGQFTRILAKALGSEITFACCPDEMTAPGQLSIEDMNQIYRYRNISTNTRFFALLGQPVEKSIGHLFHNDYFYQHGIDARYVKIEVSPQELSLFLAQSLKLPFDGFSVTTPLKITCHQLLGTEDNLSSVNTLVRKIDHWQAYNTDAPGAWNALGDFKPHSMIVLGAGAVGRAVGQYFLKKGVAVYLYNRTPREGVMEFDKTNSFPVVDLIINTIPSVPEAILIKLESRLNAQTLLMDFVYPNSSFAAWALKLHLRFISGQEVFVQQALLQQAIWNE
jgi:3-dehydroquinate dehydratase/shikimate dehydrogenase